MAQMNSADSQRQRIGGVVGFRNLVQIQQDLDHLLDLALGGLAVANGRVLDLERAELRQSFSRERGGQ